MANPLPDLVIYHGGCSDDLGAGWVYWRLFGCPKKEKVLIKPKPVEDSKQEDEELPREQYPKFWYGEHGKGIPDASLLKGKNVVMVDFSYRKAVIEQLLLPEEQGGVKTLLILDHHKSAAELLPLVGTYPQFTLVLDYERSGAHITWDYLQARHPELDALKLAKREETDRPWVIDYIGDRDLWTYKLPHSKAVNLGMFKKGHLQNFETVDRLATGEIPFESVLEIGLILYEAEITSYQFLIKRAIECWMTTPDQKKYRVALLGCEHAQASDAGNLLAEQLIEPPAVSVPVPSSYAEVASPLAKTEDKKKDEEEWEVLSAPTRKYDFAVCWRYDFKSDQWWLSLRGAKESPIDLSAIARLYPEGGGHAKAAGCALPPGVDLQSVFKIVKRP